MPDELNPWLAKNRMSGDEYDAQYEAYAAAGKEVHGEANFVELYGVRSVLDAGCGTGRTGRELARRGLDVVGVDLDTRKVDAASVELSDDLRFHGRGTEGAQDLDLHDDLRGESQKGITGTAQSETVFKCPHR